MLLYFDSIILMHVYQTIEFFETGFQEPFIGMLCCNQVVQIIALFIAKMNRIGNC